MTTQFNKIRFKNIFAVGNDWIELDLARYRSALFMGKNGAGKSTMIDALCFALYKKPFKKITLSEMVNRTTNKNLMVEVEFEINGIEYMVRRGIKPNVFEIFKNGNLVEQDAKTGDYQDFLETQVLKMNYKSFTQIVVLGIANYIPFMRLKTPERREVVEDLLDYQVFSVMNSILKERIKKNKPIMADLDARLRTVNGKIEVNASHMESLKQDKAKEIKAKKKEMKDLLFQVSEQKSTIKALYEQHNQLSYDGWGDNEQNLGKAQQVRATLLSKKKDMQKEIDFYTDHDDCPTCQQTISKDFVVDRINNRKNKIAELDAAISQLDTKIAALKEAYDKYNDIVSQATRVMKQISLEESKLAYMGQSLSRLKTEIEELSVEDEHQDMTKELEAEKNAILAEKEELERQAAVNANAALLLQDDGIKARLIRNFIPKMNELINKYLVELDFFGHFEMDENFDAVIRARHRDELSYEALSQGQKLRIDLALLFTWRAIAKIRSNASTNLLIFDEVCDSSLDDSGIEDLMKILNSMADGHNIFIISHKGDAIVDKFDQVYRFALSQGQTEMQEAA